MGQVPLSFDVRIAIAPSRSSSLRRTGSMTDLDKHTSAVAPASETYESTSALDMPLLPSVDRPVQALGVRMYPGPFTLDR